MTRQNSGNMPLPLLKLGFLVLKQLSKPVANAVKRAARVSPTFRKIVTYPTTIYHRFEVNFNRRLLGLGKSKNIRPMDPDAAVQLVAEFIGEVVLYGFLVGILYMEHRSNEVKEADKKKYLTNLENTVTDLGLEGGKMEAEIRELQRKVGELESNKSALVEQVRELEKHNEALLQKVFPQKKGYIW